MLNTFDLLLYFVIGIMVFLNISFLVPWIFVRSDIILRNSALYFI